MEIQKHKIDMAIAILILLAIAQIIMLALCIKELKFHRHLLYANILANDYIVEGSSNTYHRVQIDKE